MAFELGPAFPAEIAEGVAAACARVLGITLYICRSRVCRQDRFFITAAPCPEDEPVWVVRPDGGVSSPSRGVGAAD
jgi:hypothetical protein